MSFAGRLGPCCPSSTSLSAVTACACPLPLLFLTTSADVLYSNPAIVHFNTVDLQSDPSAFTLLSDGSIRLNQAGYYRLTYATSTLSNGASSITLVTTKNGSDILTNTTTLPQTEQSADVLFQAQAGDTVQVQVLNLNGSFTLLAGATLTLALL